MTIDPDDAAAAHKVLSGQWFYKRGVAAIGIGLLNDREPNSGAALIVFLKNEEAVRELSLPTFIEVTNRGRSVRVPVRVVISGEFVANGVARPEDTQARAADPEYCKKLRPVRSGYSVGQDYNAGSIAMCGDTPSLLTSNCHVLVEDNSPRRVVTYQPGGIDSGAGAINAIGHLHSYVPLTNTNWNVIDAAMTVVDSPAILSNLYGQEGLVVEGIYEDGWDGGKWVKKCGRTTGSVQGHITAKDADVKVNYYTYGNLGEIPFTKVVIVGGDGAAVSLPGDSGSLWYLPRPPGWPIGALLINFAGGPNGGYSISFPAIRIRDHWRRPGTGRPDEMQYSVPVELIREPILAGKGT